MITNFQEIHIALVSVLMNQNRQPETIRRYTEVLNAIIRFHKKQGLNEANVEQIVEFQKIKNNYSVAIGASLESVRRWERAILVILKVIHNDKIEIEKAINSFEKVDALGNKIFVSITNQDIWPDTFKKIFIKFKNYSLQKLAIDTCNKYLYIVKRFFQNLINVGIDDLNNINEDKFLNAITEITSRSQYGTKQIIGIKSFFAWAYRNNEITKDYSEYLNFQSAKYIPNVLFFSEEQINKLLSNIDLTTYDGKMFHAIITVAKTTGLRKTDICMLKIKDFDWNNKIINVKQSKTGKYISCPITQDAFQSLSRYLLYARPKDAEVWAFVDEVYPYKPISKNKITKMLLKHRRKIFGVELERHGFHAIRRGVGTLLFANEIEPSIISQILGHKDERSLTHYIKADLEHLRSCCMPLGEKLAIRRIY